LRSFPQILIDYKSALGHEPQTDSDLRADGVAAVAGAAAQRPDQKLEGQTPKPPWPARLATLLRPAQVPAQGHGHLRARLLDFHRHALCAVSHCALRR